jgi:SPP1 family predicted phage head-tail adaptor
VIGPGKLDRRIVLERATVTQNDFNEDVESWGDLAEIFAGRRDASASESYRAQEVGGQITVRFTIRWSSQVADLNPRDRLRYGGRIYNITAVRETQRNRWLEVDAVARADIGAEDVGSP